MEVLRPLQSEAWRQVLAECPAHDFYHLPGYHALAESRGEGESLLLAYRDEGYTLALPLLVRPVRSIAGLEDVSSGETDATSVYGYAGPIASHELIPGAVIARFHAALRATLLSLRVATVFSRLHPLLPQAGVLAGLGETIPRGKTVSIDLTRTIEEQRAGYRYSLRRDLKLLGKRGVTCEVDRGNARLHTFAAVYREAMARLGANEDYFFDDTYFDQLAAALGDSMQLFLCVLEGRVIAGGIFTALNGIAQAHLTGCLDEFVKISPQKMLYDVGSIWARERGCFALHLGGGVGSREDSLFHFKLGFSHVTHAFSTWQWIVDPSADEALAARRAQWMETHSLLPATADYFPAYRVPMVGAEAPTAAASSPSTGASVLLGALLAGGLSFEGLLPDERKRPGEPTAARSLASTHHL
jgi:Acetyltransferase (GNAT) domain